MDHQLKRGDAIDSNLRHGVGTLAVALVIMICGGVIALAIRAFF